MVRVLVSLMCVYSNEYTVFSAVSIVCAVRMYSM